jgi:hypothetical protein
VEELRPPSDNSIAVSDDDDDDDDNNNNKNNKVLQYEISRKSVQWEPR